MGNKPDQSALRRRLFEDTEGWIIQWRCRYAESGVVLAALQAGRATEAKWSCRMESGRCALVSVPCYATVKRSPRAVFMRLTATCRTLLSYASLPVCPARKPFPVYCFRDTHSLLLDSNNQINTSEDDNFIRLLCPRKWQPPRAFITCSSYRVLEKYGAGIFFFLFQQYKHRLEIIFSLAA